MTSMITMWDDTNIGLIPAGPEAVAGYVDGAFNNFNAMVARFPNAKHLSITVFGNRAQCADVENGDMTNAGIFRWFKNEQAAGTWRPVIYTSVSNVNAVVATMTANGFARSSYRLWSAHYGIGPHVCGPDTCKLTAFACDGTQFTSTARGESLDESELEPGFFGGSPPPPPPSNWTEALVDTLPTIQQGSTGQAVRDAQALLGAHGHAVTVDGNFGPVTKGAVEAFQRGSGLSVDGIVGQDTWTALI